jgi:hypothetical protein
MLSAIALLLIGSNASAVILDWGNLPSGQSWVNGDLSNAFNVDATNPGNDITVSVASSGVPFSSGYPQNSQVIPGSMIASNDAFSLRLRTTGMVNSTNSITVTINFNYALGVNNVTFSLFDIDAVADLESNTGYIDNISAISATAVGGGLVALTATNANNTVTTLAGSGTLGMTATGNVPAGNITDHSGDVTLSTDGTPITSITFTWNNPGPDFFNGQIIALGNISFTSVVPEVGSGLGALCLCGGVLPLWRRRPSPRVVAAA